MVLLFFNACETKVKTGIEGKKQNAVTIKRSKDTINSIFPKEENNTYKIKGRSLIFFIISQKEYIQVLKHSNETDRYDFDNLFNSFKLNAFAFKNVLEKEKIKSDLTTARNFEIELNGGRIIKFNRTSDDQIIGQIFSDGIKKPRFEFGMISPKELAEIVREYFNTETIAVPLMQQLIMPDTTKKENKQ